MIERGPTFSLYIGNLSQKTFDLDLYKHFTSKGYKLYSAKIMFDKETNKSKGFGYLNFGDKDEANRCLNEMNNTAFDSRQIVLNLKKDKDFDSKANVVVRNLPKDFDQKDLANLFS